MLYKTNLIMVLSFFTQFLELPWYIKHNKNIVRVVFNTAYVAPQKKKINIEVFFYF